MNGTIKVIGGKKLTGEVVPIPNKNSFMPALPAAVLVKGKTIFRDVPKTTDVSKHFAILRELGATIDDSNYSKVTIDCSDISKHSIDSPLAKQYRSSILYVGPLLARMKKARVPLPGGCALGARSIAAHINAFKAVGVEVVFDDDFVDFSIKEPKKEGNYDIWQIEASVTATENIAMYAAGTNASFKITNAAVEPHVTDLLSFLIEMGVKIEGIGSNVLKISGSNDLGTAEFIPRPDHIDIIGYIVAAALTKGEIRIRDSNVPDIVEGIIQNLSLFNIDIKKDGRDLVVRGGRKVFVDWETSGIPLAAPGLPKFKPEPWPGYPVDGIPVIATLASKANGQLLLQNWMYENGLNFVNVLNEMGANIYMSDPQRVIITGPIDFKSAEVISPGIIQACKAIFLAALTDPVETIIHGVNSLKRRYPDIFEIYQSLGADIEILE